MGIKNESNILSKINPIVQIKGLKMEKQNKKIDTRSKMPYKKRGVKNKEKSAV